MKRKATAIATILAAASLLVTAPAMAQEDDAFVGENCMAAQALESFLKRAFSEGRIASAWSDSGNRVELFAGPSGTWTLIEFAPEGGGGCVRAHGSGLRIDRIKLPLRYDYGL